MSSIKNPIDIVEQYITKFKWVFQRINEHELNTFIVGDWCQYNVTAQWNDKIDGMHWGVALDFEMKQGNISELKKLITLINEQLWLGQFEYWEQHQMLMFRYGTICAKGRGFDELQCHTLVTHIIETCEHYYGAFQCTIFAKQSAEQALLNCLLDQQGSA